MESDEESLIFSPPQDEDLPYPKLRRLKKARSVSSVPPSDDNLHPSLFIVAAASDSSDGLDRMEPPPKSLDVEISTDQIHPLHQHQSDGINVRDKAGDGLDDLFDYQNRLHQHQSDGIDVRDKAGDGLDDLFDNQNRSVTQDPLDIETDFESGDLDGRRDAEGTEFDKAVDGLRMEKSSNKRLSPKRSEEKEKKKKKKRNTSIGNDGKREESARGKRKLEKERQGYLDLIHAESQRLLRETRDASFKSLPLVQKPISSVLEKIRLRKQEVSKKSGLFYSTDSLADTGTSLRNNTQSHERQHVEGNNRRVHNDADEETGVSFLHPKSCDVRDSQVDGSDLSDSPVLFNTAQSLDDKSQNTSQTPTDDKKDLLNAYDHREKEDKQPENHEKNSQENVLAPSFLVSKPDSVSLDADSSDEEYGDEENIDPCPHKLNSVDFHQKGDPVKAFVDDEAEEEDDSDNDLMRFRENEDDEENEEDEELDDLIVTGYKEKPIDNEKRDELHQKWLQQQDAAATDNVLQRLKCGWKQSDPILFQEEEGDDDSMDNAIVDLHPTNVTRKNPKRVKQMIAQMFTDEDDVFLSSDDEETEQRLVRQRILEQSEEQASFVSPAEDENSREVFGRIKKLNIAPNTKKKAKTSSFFETMVSGGNSNSSSRSSFLGKVPNSSLPSSHKQGTSLVRSFIFGRDDSNSRSGMSVVDLSSNTDEKEKHPTRIASAKFSSCQSKSTGHNTKNENEGSTNCRPSSLFEILRQPSTHSDNHIQKKTQSNSYEIRQSQALNHFAAFKSTKKAIKMESKSLILHQT